MGKRFDQRFISILEARIFADTGNGHFAFGIMDALGDRIPACHIRLGSRLDAEGREHFAIKSRFMIGARHIVNRTDIARFDHRCFAHIAEQSELAAFFHGDFAIRTA